MGTLALSFLDEEEACLDAAFSCSSLVCLATHASECLAAF